MKPPFRDLREYRAETARVKERLTRHNDVMDRHLAVLRDRDQRRAMAVNAAMGMIGSLDPGRMIKNVFFSEHGFLTGLVSAFVTTRAKTLKGKLFAWVATATVPHLIKTILGSEVLQDWLNREEEEGTEEEQTTEQVAR